MVKRSHTRMGEVYVGQDAVIKLGEQHTKTGRQDRVHKLGDQINDLLLEKVIEPLRRNSNDGVEILLAFLAYESQPPLIDTFKGDLQEYALKASRKEGIGYIYDRLDKLVKKKIQEESN